ncbi:Uncharacterized protein DBV15_09367 [Temnothorax longispinosus]|uniref:Uncharacterized protein n=1 Tax=Temnothorax longispinosus TaxID=300112 RepID=A0A4S2KFM2_9HYME|nr:Uncharacterized protein DBV15_09367 [Temnothorax longispinosus]
MSDSCATTPPSPPPSGDYANVIINCQCSLFNDSSSRSLNTPNCRDVTKIAIQVHRCVSKLLIRRGGLRQVYPVAPSKRGGRRPPPPPGIDGGSAGFLPAKTPRWSSRRI